MATRPVPRKTASPTAKTQDDALSDNHIEFALRGRPEHIQDFLSGFTSIAGTLWNFATTRSIALVQTEVQGAVLSDKLNGPKLNMQSPNELLLYGNRCVSAAAAIGVYLADPNSFVNGIKGTQSVQEVGDALYYAGL